MEPTIYKPSIYNGAVIYKGAGVYKGTGVYKDGSGNGGFYFLNNFDNYLFENNIATINSVVGKEFTASYDIGQLLISPYFNVNSLYLYTLYSSSNRASADFSLEKNSGCLTIELFLSGLTKNVYASWFDAVFPWLRLAMDGNGNKPLFEIFDYTSNWQLYNGATKWSSTSNVIRVFGVGGANYLHIAVVIDFDEKKIYCFGNGVLYFVCEVSSFRIDNKIQFRNYEQDYRKYLDFISVRDGDFSNSRSSFPVPNQKYSL